ncbi:FG-GAP repeat protein [Lacimicrobium alkaliphilum]|uniref:Uncharacterized protein n=1 Tax=Lacimicrobium alkaliphilum TaxID=1526571 RepID=A0A0U3AGJ7_9ALTE|nr:FG-GAP repeat protein [Lacimicrobium alkaliphilum]ALS97170.1 hypothetical protein AT746_01995 [Lacimicrobium alkaliphilum]
MKSLKLLLLLWVPLAFTATSGAEVQPVVQQAYLKADSPGPREQFGHSVDLNGNTLAIGSPGVGAAYVFSISDGIWSQHASVVPGDAGHKEQFGYSIALDGDTLVVGAPRHIGGGSAFLGSGGSMSFPVLTMCGVNRLS